MRHKKFERKGRLSVWTATPSLIDRKKCLIFWRTRLSYNIIIASLVRAKGHISQRVLTSTIFRPVSFSRWEDAFSLSPPSSLLPPFLPTYWSSYEFRTSPSSEITDSIISCVDSAGVESGLRPFCTLSLLKSNTVRGEEALLEIG